MKKIIPFLLIIIIISNIFLPNKILAYDGTTDSKETKSTNAGEVKVNRETYEKDSEEGSSTVGDNKEKKGYEIEDGTMNSLIKNFVKFVNVIPTTVQIILTFLTDGTTTAEVDKQYGQAFSIQKLVFNKIGIFDINFFDSINQTDETTLQGALKANIAKIYYALRNIAIVGMLLVLIYTGIRMAMSAVASEKAKYKTMLYNWLSGFAILMVLPYIMIIIIQINHVLINLCETIMTDLCGEKIKAIESTIFNSSTTSTEKGFSIIIPTILYWMITFYQLKFFLMYGKRLLNTAFLVVISPLVLVQYIFDKVADNEGSSFNTWIKEYTLNIFMQPLHAVLYMIFMTIASNIVKEAPILAVIFLGALSRGERVLRNILNVKNGTTVQSMSDNLKFKEVVKKMG